MGMDLNEESDEPIAQINFIPMIDISLVLLIIFMVTAPMITPSLIDLPSVGKANKQPDKVLQVVNGQLTEKEVPMLNALNEVLRDDYIKDSIGGLTSDRRLQAMLIAFALGAFIEGAAGFGTPVAVAAAICSGLAKAALPMVAR